MDKNGNNLLDRHELQWGLKENGHSLSPSEFERLFKFFDKNNDGVVSYNEFLGSLRGELSPKRMACLSEVCAHLAKDGKISLAEMNQATDWSVTKEFKNGSMTRKQLEARFCGYFEKQQKDGLITVQDYIDFHTDVAVLFPTDEAFESAIKQVFAKCF